MIFHLHVSIVRAPGCFVANKPTFLILSGWGRSSIADAKILILQLAL